MEIEVLRLQVHEFARNAAGTAFATVKRVHEENRDEFEQRRWRSLVHTLFSKAHGRQVSGLPATLFPHTVSLTPTEHLQSQHAGHSADTAPPLAVEGLHRGREALLADNCKYLTMWRDGKRKTISR